MILAVLLVGWALVGAPFALWPGGAVRYVLEEFGRTLVVFILIVAAVRHFEDVRRLVAAFAIGVALFAILSPVPGVSRGVAGGGYDPNDAGMLLATGLPALIFFGLVGRGTHVRLAATLGVLAAVGTLVLTESRGGFLAAVGVLAFMVLMLRGVRPWLRAAVVVGVVAISVPMASSEYWERMETIRALDDGYGPEGAVGGRRAVWTRAIGYAWERPLTGVGVGNFTVAEGARADVRDRIRHGVGAKYSAAHSMWFQVLAELGFPGFFIFLSMLALVMYGLRGVQVSVGRPPPGSASHERQVLAGVLMACLVGAMVAGTFLSNAYSALLWVPLGLATGLIKVAALGRAAPAFEVTWSGRSGATRPGAVHGASSWKP